MGVEDPAGFEDLADDLPELPPRLADVCAGRSFIKMPIDMSSVLLSSTV